MKEIKVALIGTPNVGKSTIYNNLTNNKVHTGNWTGKTVEASHGTCKYLSTIYHFYDLPGTYSLISKSKEETVATDFIIFEEFDVAVVVLDATSLIKGINLVLQTKEICKKVVVVINLMDEAKKNGININVAQLAKNLDVLVVPTTARDNVGLTNILKAIDEVKESDYLDISYGVIDKYIEEIKKDIKDSFIPSKWIALRVIDNNIYYQNKFINKGILKLSTNSKNILKNISEDVSLEIVLSISKHTKLVLDGVITKENVNNENKIDKILTSKTFGIPIMILMLFGIFYLTIVGANYPSNLLFNIFSKLELYLFNLLKFIHIPSILVELIVHGIYKTLYWVVSVMTPPMLIFFPLFTFLEDLGLLPRIAFNLDKCFMKCETCGKQALTMCMGIGCNAVGVTSSRIIDSKRERIIAILTNVFMPCNGKFPTIIAIITMFFLGTNNKYGAFISALILTFIVILGIILTFITSFILSKTLLKGSTSSFILEIPPFRMPKIWQTIKYSIKNRALFVLKRSFKVTIIAGVIIWIIANIKINNIVILKYLTDFLNPIGTILGLDGVIILGILLGLPANEIVIPVILMSYLNAGSLLQYNGYNELKSILVSNGWTLKTAICFLVLMLYHYPCSTTLITIKKETSSTFYTFLGFIIPLFIGLVICLILNLVI